MTLRKELKSFRQSGGQPQALLNLYNDWKNPTISDIKVIAKTQNCGKGWIPIFTNSFLGLRTLWNDRIKAYSFHKKQYYYSYMYNQADIDYYYSDIAFKVGDAIAIRSRKSTKYVYFYRILLSGTPPLELSILDGKRICGKKSISYGDIKKRCPTGKIRC